MTDSVQRPFDIAVVGAGPIGLAAAAVLKQAAYDSVRIVVIDPRPGVRDGKLRCVALATGSRHILERVGAWSELEPLTQPIVRMAIFDGGVRDVLRLEQLGFSAEHDAPLAYMAANDDLADALNNAAKALGVEFLTASVEAFEAGVSTARLTMSDGSEVRARLVIAADGANSRLRALAKIPVTSWATGQSAIVATIAHELEHEGRAEQHFLPAGPFAILPLRGRSCSIVWTERHADAEAMLACDEESLLRQLELRFTSKLGALSFASPLRHFPLRLQIARAFHAPRLALIGDAAHLVHPLAGQGLNLGLRDVAALCASIIEPMRLGLDPADPEALAAYQRARRFDVASSAMGMDAMNRLFSNDAAPLRAVRDLGLRLVDHSAPLKRLFVSEAAGSGRGAPRMLRGLGL